jgi:5'-3' exonuclease
MKILNKLSREILPDLIVVVWDGESGSQKRRSMNKNYKQGRKPLRLNRQTKNLTDVEEKQNKIWQQMRAIEYLNCMPVIQFMEPRVEADDVISYVVNHPAYEEYNKVVVSSDKDFFQLLNHDTILYRPTQSEVLNMNSVVEKYNIHPTNFALARAVVGDLSDNLKGVKGVGLATMAKRFDKLRLSSSVSLDDIFEMCNTKVKEKGPNTYYRILENENLIRENYKIMQLYSPSISIQLKTKINNVLNEYEPEFNKTKLRSTMHKDGIGEISLNNLFESFNRTISDFSLSKTGIL